jgi:hypothetical protein
MPRVTSGEVQAILLENYDGSSSLVPFITAANLTVTQVSTTASSKSITLSDDTLKEIERWLAAHLYVMSDQVLEREVVGRSGGSFQGKTGMNLDASKFGQMAKMLDPSGILATMGKGKARLVWGGKKPSESTDYEDRD